MTAAFLDRITNPARAGVTRPFLAEHLSRRAGDFAARERANAPLPLVRVIGDNRLLEQVFAHGAAELRLVDLQALHLLAGLIEYRDFNHDSCSFLIRAVIDLRTKRSPPFGPGKAPLISNKLFSASIFTRG